MEGRSERFYAVLSRINHLLVRCRDPGVFLAQACRIAVTEGNFVLSWVGVVDPDSPKVRVLTSAGKTDGYLDTINIDMEDEARSQGPTGLAIRTRTHHFANDIEKNGTMEPWKNDLAALGVRSSGAFPLVVSGKVWGVFTLYSAEKNFFDAEEVRLVDELTSDLSFAIESFQTASAHRETELRLRQMAEAVNEVFFLTDIPSGEILYISPRYEDLWGRPCEALLKDPLDWVRAVHPDDQDRVRKAFKALQTPESLDGEFRILRPDGGLRWVRTRAFPVRDPDGVSRRIAGVCEDITTRKAQEEARLSLEAQLYQSQKVESLGELAGGIAHDFNNVLGIILGHVSILEALPADKPFPRKNLESIRNAGVRGTNLVGQLMAFARKSETALEPLQLNLVIAEVLDLLGITFPRTVSLVTDLEDSLPLVNGDGTQVHQVLLNLCVNARDAMPAGGTLTVSTRRIDLSGAVVLRVSDTGTGMDEKTRMNVFKPFFTTKPKGKGTGLGLAVVSGIMEGHHGSVTVDSEPGKGTTFTCRFPPLALGSSATEEKGHGTILLVGVEALMRDWVTEYLESKGFTVLLAADGTQGPVDLVITDLVGLEGPLFQGIPRILVSSFFDEELKARVALDKNVDLLSKPFEPSTLFQAIRRRLG